MRDDGIPETGGTWQYREHTVVTSPWKELDFPPRKRQPDYKKVCKQMEKELYLMEAKCRVFRHEEFTLVAVLYNDQQQGAEERIAYGMSRCSDDENSYNKWAGKFFAMRRAIHAMKWRTKNNPPMSSTDGKRYLSYKDKYISSDGPIVRIIAAQGAAYKHIYYMDNLPASEVWRKLFKFVERKAEVKDNQILFV
jgi:hypothetical protein